MNVKCCLSVSELAYDNSGPNTKINFDHVDKVKFSLERAMKAQRGGRGIALVFL